MRNQILRFLAFCSVLLGQALAVSADHLGPGKNPAPVTRTHSTPTNVILITIDTVRADHLACYGATNIQTPTIDGLARDGILFERAISQVPLTWPSHAAILSGMYPFQNGVQDFTGQPLDLRIQSVAQAFKQHGYATGAVVSAFVLDRSWGLARGFDFYDDAFAPEAFQHRELGLVDRKAEESVTHAITWLKKSRRLPFFLWLHLYDPHSPYDPPEPFRTEYHNHLYDGEIAYADHELGRLTRFLKENYLYDRSLIIFLSDHGESLGEHGEHEHGFFVYNSTVHIPLIVKPPAGRGFRAGRISVPVETTAVAPTLLRMAGIKSTIEKQFHSPSLLSEEELKETSAYSETLYTFSSFGWSPLHSLETSHYHYIDSPAPELFDLTADPQEQKNVATEQTAVAAVFKDQLQKLLRDRRFNSAQDQTAKLDPNAEDKLRALGYVSYRSPVSAAALAAGLPDPKSKLWEFNSILQAGDYLRAGDIAAGESLLRQVAEKNPQMYVVPYMLGESKLTQQKWDEAVEELRKSLELNPNFDQAMLALGRALIFQGRADEAKVWSRKAIQFNPENYRAWYQLAFIESKANKPAAIADYEKAVSIQGNFAQLRRDLGLLQFEQQNYPEAVKHLARAVELGINDAVLYNDLGIAYSRTGNPGQAIVNYKKALEINPQLAQAHLNLGFAYEQSKQTQLSEQEYARACELQLGMCSLIKEHTKH